MASSDDDDNNVYKGMTAAQLNTEAHKALLDGNYVDAAKRYEALDAMYPFSKYSESAQQELIYAYYKKGDYPSTAATAERYIHLFPRSKHVDYAYYMKGLANFNQPRGTFSKFFPLDVSWRSPGTQTQAYSDFSTLIKRFPDSRYKPNALQHLIYLRNNLAQRELNAANYYFKRSMYVAAVGRASYVVKNYSQAPQKKPALELIYESNKRLGLFDAANDARNVYQATYHETLA